ncbi:ABC transporter substrate-binding protein [Nocardiopsis suaedae]|uniref:Iron-siderophore ABC transporter substrate-binding protein n=1 Tax=Nocardiopsis suaedae TaxID=3018444 RepID=A0ABT4TJE7_9ACTN|nr:iron-siderophore ABC transporter substrate-binding protein [Nocardiopsis suaedae]MDA2804721.1 iron-siderophore ABC transporter substrate-binding protein [Nocardiopsis suaedae]
MPQTTRGRTARLLPFALPAAAVLAVSACGGGADTGGSGGSGDASGETRTVEHARGTTEVPADPQKVVVLEPVQLDTSVALGTVPVGAALFDEAAGVPEYLGEEAADVQGVGTVPEPDIEEIAALEPDLVIGTESRHSALYDKLSDVAPTVFMESQADPWQDNVDLVASALGKEDEAEELLGDYEARCDEIAEKYGTEGSTAQVIRPRDDVLSLYGPTSFAGSTLECAGFTTPEHDWEDISLDISPEKVLDAKADLVLVTADDPDADGAVPPSISDNEDEFPELYTVENSFWIAGVGPKGGMTVLDDLDRILDESDAFEASE